MIDRSAVVILSNDRNTRELFERWVRGFGLQPHAFDSVEAYEEASIDGARVYAVVTGIQLNGQHNGFTAIRHIKRSPPPLPRIVLATVEERSHPEVSQILRAWPDVVFRRKPIPRPQNLAEALDLPTLIFTASPAPK